jgi:hypothetical protein
MEQYFAQLDKIIKERKTSSRIRFMLLDVIDLRRVLTLSMLLVTIVALLIVTVRFH